MVIWGSLNPTAHKVLFEASEHLWQVWGLILNEIEPLLPFLEASPLPLDMVCFVGSNILLSIVVQQQVAVLEFSQEKMSAHPTTSSLSFF